jgi:FMN-dependent NADH-azoreductase
MRRLRLSLRQIAFPTSCLATFSRQKHDTIFPGEIWHHNWHQCESNTNTNRDSQNKNLKFTNILHLNVGHNSNSLVTQAAKQLIDKLAFPFRLKELNLWTEPLIHYDCNYAVSKLKILKSEGSREDVEKFEPVLFMAQEMNLVDVLVISTPMWNYSIPYVLKQYIDIVIQPGINFTQSPGSPPKPVRGDRPFILFTSSGGKVDKETDFMAPYLKAIFAMVGFDNFENIHVSGMSSSRPEEILQERISDLAQILANHAQP